MIVNRFKTFGLAFFIVLTFTVNAQKIKVIQSDTLIYSQQIPDYVEKIIFHDSTSVWAYYDYTDCADFFLSNNNKDSSFLEFFNKNKITVLSHFISTDGYVGVRCNLCKCPNGQRFNFKISKRDFENLIKLFEGTMNQQKFIRY